MTVLDNNAKERSDGPFMMTRASVLIEEVTDDNVMGPTAMLPACSHGTRDSTPDWAHDETRQPVAMPEMRTFTGRAAEQCFDLSLQHPEFKPAR